jgi:hypothetical protein
VKFAALMATKLRVPSAAIGPAAVPRMSMTGHGSTGV